MSELVDLLSPLPAAGEPVLVAPGVVEVDGYTFDAETIADALVGEARYVAAVLAAKRLLDEVRLADRRERVLKAAKIASDVFDSAYPTSYAKAKVLPDVTSPFYKIADAILLAVDDGEL